MKVYLLKRADGLFKVVNVGIFFQLIDLEDYIKHRPEPLMYTWEELEIINEN